MSNSLKIGSDKDKQFNLFLTNRGFRPSESVIQYPRDGSERVVQEESRHTSIEGVAIHTFDRGPMDGCVAISAGGNPWIDPCEALTDVGILAKMLDCYASMFASAKEHVSKQPVPGDEEVAFTKTLRRDGVLIIKHTAGAFAGKSEIKLPGGGSFVNACTWLSDQQNLMVALEVLDSMFEQQKKLRKKLN